ncbi:MAG: hypothetical protein QW334_02365, partial [Thermofilum sp.]
GSKGAYTLLIELPIIPDDPSQQPAQGASAAQWVGWAAANLYGLLQEVALGLLAVVLIIAAMCYIFETFRFMSEGTAMNIILNSVFALILIFAVRYIYNGVAAAINAFTGWPDVGGTGLIIQGGHEIDTLINAMGGGVLTGWDVAVRFFGSVVIFIICTSILILSVMMGAVRLLLIGCLAAALPLLLMLRLIPPTKHLTDSLIETVIGIMFASIIAAILIHFGFVLVAMTGLGGITKLVVALATFAGAAYMSTMFAGRLGGLFVTMGGMASTASSMATGLLLGGAAMGAGTVSGGVTAAVKAGKAGLTGTAKLQSIVGGIGAGLATTGAAVLPSIITGRGPGRVLAAGAGALPGAVSAAQDVVKNRAGTVTENLLYKFAAERYPGESAHMGLEWYKNTIEGRTDRQIGEYLSDKLGFDIGDTEKLGAEFRGLVESGKDEKGEAKRGLKEQPVLLDRVRRHLEHFRSASPEEKAKTIKDVLDGKKVGKYKNTVEKKVKDLYDPKMELLDWQPGYYDKLLDNSQLGMTGRIAKARIFALAREGFEDRVYSGALDVNVGHQVAERIIGPKDARKSDYEVGKWASEKLGIFVPNEDKKTTADLGHEVKELFHRMELADPRLLDNFERELARAGDLRKKDPKLELEKFEDNKQWLQRLWVGEKPILGTRGSPPPPPPSPPSPPSGDSGSGGSSGAQPSSPPPTKKKRLKSDINDAENMNKILEEIEKEKRKD